MLKPSVAIVVETHFEVNTIVIEVDNQMAVVQIQVGKNIIEDVLIDGRAIVNIFTEINKIRFAQTKTNSIPP
jgi:hypothetical protein